MTPQSLQLIPLDQIVDHPQNPRLLVRQDVVDGIAANLNGAYPQQHAIHVRPKDGVYETLAGHHRRRAAAQAGLTEIWAWVEEMDDAAAYMELVLSNAQGELLPLEYGLHVLQAVPREVGGRGQKGGLAAYAERIGRSPTRLTRYRQAAEVFVSTRETIAAPQWFLDKTDHLTAIYAADPATWSALVDYLVQQEGTLSAERLADKVQQVRHFQIPAHHQFWLPLADLARRFLMDNHPTPRMVRQLIDEGDAILVLLAEHEINFADYHALCHEQCRLATWDRRALLAYRHQLELTILEAEGKLPEGVTLYQQDFREITMEPASVDLILTDPPYDTESGQLYADLSACASEWLKPGGSLIVYCGQGRLGPVLSALQTNLRYWWTLALLHQGTTQIMPIQEIAVGWKPLAWLSKGEPDFRLRSDVLEGAGREKTAHPWQQAVDEARMLIRDLCPTGGVVLDPMMGSGTTILAALAEGRRAVGFERDSDTFDAAERRIRGDDDDAV